MSGLVTNADLDAYLAANPQAGQILAPENGGGLGVTFDRCVLNNRLMFPVTPDLRCFPREYGIFRDAVYDMVGQPPSPVFRQALEQPAAPGKYFGMGSFDNYFHWSMDFLPRLALRTMLPDGDERRIVIHQQPNAWQAASLRLFMMGLGLDSMDLFVSTGEWTCYPDCFVPFAVRRHAVGIWDVVLNRTRDSRPPPNGPKRLFLTRRDTTKRVPVNQDEVAAALERLGFLCTDPGALSFEQEIALFGNVEIVVGCFGAALTNILFAPPGSTLVELRGSVPQPFYRQLAQARGMRYADVAYTEIAGSHPELIDQDYVIPLDALLERLAGLGIR